MDRFSIILKKSPPPKKKVKKRVTKEKQPPEKDELIERLALSVSLLEQEIKHRKRNNSVF